MSPPPEANWSRRIRWRAVRRRAPRGAGPAPGALDEPALGSSRPPSGTRRRPRRGTPGRYPVRFEEAPSPRRPQPDGRTPRSSRGPEEDAPVGETIDLESLGQDALFASELEARTPRRGPPSRACLRSPTSPRALPSGGMAGCSAQARGRGGFEKSGLKRDPPDLSDNKEFVDMFMTRPAVAGLPPNIVKISTRKTTRAYYIAWSTTTAGPPTIRAAPGSGAFAALDLSVRSWPRRPPPWSSSPGRDARADPRIVHRNQSPDI